MEPRIIAILQCATGNASVGSEWMEAVTLQPGTTVEQVMAWRDEVSKRNGVSSVGKLLLANEDSKADTWVSK